MTELEIFTRRYIFLLANLIASGFTMGLLLAVNPILGFVAFAYFIGSLCIGIVLIMRGWPDR